MICNRCGKEFDSGETCPYCGAQHDTVRVMSREETRQYNGITLESGTNEEADYRESFNKNGVNFKVYTVSSFGFLPKLILGVMLLAIGIIATFALLPVVLILAISVLVFCVLHHNTITSWWQKIKSIGSFLRYYKG